jgi:hypothetical protein
MDASFRIADEFDRLIAIGLEGLHKCSFAERAVFWIVSTRCEIDMNGFSSVYEQLLGKEEGKVMVEGLRRIGEAGLAQAFERGMELLRGEGFYSHLNWGRVASDVREKVERIEDEVGDRLWDLDEKLVRMLEERGSEAK